MIRKALVFSVILLVAGTLSCGDGGSGGEKNGNTDDNEGKSRTFWVLDWTTYEPYECKSSLVKTGSHCIVYVEDEMKSMVKQEGIDRIVDRFDNEVYPMVSDKFAQPVDIDKNGKVILLILDIRDGTPGDGLYQGYFSSSDFKSSKTELSNECDMIYLDYYRVSISKYTDSLISIVSHEFEHLVNYCVHGIDDKTGDEDVWINEGLASVAECYTEGGGQLEDECYWYNKNCSDPDNFYNFGYRSIDYSTVYMFFQWIRFQSDDDAVFRDIIHSDYTDYRAVVEGMIKHVPEYKGLSVSDPVNAWKTILGDWLIANQINSKSGLHGYKGKLTDLALRDMPAKSYSLYPGESVMMKLTAEYSPVNPNAAIAYKAFSKDGSVDETAPYSGDYLLVYNYNSSVDGGKVEIDLSGVK